jgi:hypothetical protein
MTIEKLAKLCLQFLEQDAETDVMNTSISELENDDTFAEYLINMEHSIYMGLVRYATSKILPLQEVSIPEGKNTHKMEDDAKRRLFHAIKEVYAEDENGCIVSNIPYYVIGKKIVLKEYNKDYLYNVIYYPTINDLSTYATTGSIWDIDLEELGVPDEMAINLKYMVYSDMKTEESPSMANQCKNIFENYLDAMSTTQIMNNQTEYISSDWGDMYGD